MKRLTIVTAVLAALIAVPAAEASTRQVTILQDDVHLRHDTAATLDEFSALGADVVKIGLSWDEVAPNGRRKPSGFDAGNPAAYQWGNYPQVIEAISARGMRPYRQRRRPRARLGVEARRAARHEPARAARSTACFAEAVGKQFPGVDLWSLWNEPNLYSWLSPQRKQGTPLSPSIYRNLYLAGHAGLERSGHGADTILLGELMPRGGTSSKKIPPARLPARDGLPRPQLPPVSAGARRASAAASGSAASRPRASPTTPTRRAGGPQRRREWPRRRRDRPAVARVTRDARRARPPRQAARGALPIWITEFGYQTEAARPVRQRRSSAPPPSWTRASGSPTATGGWRATRSTRCATIRRPGSGRGAGRPGRPACASPTAARSRASTTPSALPLVRARASGGRVEVFGAVRTASGGDVAGRGQGHRAPATVPLGTVRGRTASAISGALPRQGAREAKVPGHAWRTSRVPSRRSPAESVPSTPSRRIRHVTVVPVRPHEPCWPPWRPPPCC